MTYLYHAATALIAAVINSVLALLDTTKRLVEETVPFEVVLGLSPTLALSLAVGLSKLALYVFDIKDVEKEANHAGSSNDLQTESASEGDRQSQTEQSTSFVPKQHELSNNMEFYGHVVGRRFGFMDWLTYAVGIEAVATEVNHAGSSNDLQTESASEGDRQSQTEQSTSFVPKQHELSNNMEFYGHVGGRRFSYIDWMTYAFGIEAVEKEDNHAGSSNDLQTNSASECDRQSQTERSTSSVSKQHELSNNIDFVGHVVGRRFGFMDWLTYAVGIEAVATEVNHAGSSDSLQTDSAHGCEARTSQTGETSSVPINARV
jgi:hypothetical protein